MKQYSSFLKKRRIPCYSTPPSPSLFALFFLNLCPNFVMVVVPMSTSSRTPNQPFRYLSKHTTTATSANPPDLCCTGSGMQLFEFSEEFLNMLSEAEQCRQDAYEKSKQLQLAIWNARSAMEYENNQEQEAERDQQLDDLVRQNSIQWQQQQQQQQGEVDHSIKTTTKAPTKEWNFFSVAMEEYARYKAFRHFLSTGSLIRLSDFTTTTTNTCPLRDEEYLAGACIGLTQDLVRYATGRATVQDAESVHMARNLTDSLNFELLQFDFRNGPLRKKYDGVKYALKHLERILYELSMLSLVESTGTTSIIDEGSKASLVCQEEMNQIRQRMEQYDNMREQLIKNCRDGQRAAKQAIFALHRQDVDGALQLLHQCETIIHNELLQTHTLPELRNVGSLSALLEEYAEAKLLYLWMQEKRIANYRYDFTTPFDDAPLLLQPEEYVGALSDFTGEVGRWAVTQGTKRDVNSVKWCLETNMSIRNAIQGICFSQESRVVHKQKIDQLRSNVEKLERMLYELSWTQGRPGSSVAVILAAAAAGEEQNSSVRFTSSYEDDAEEEDRTK